jgi:hypothetical protein
MVILVKNKYVVHSRNSYVTMLSMRLCVLGIEGKLIQV